MNIFVLDRDPSMAALYHCNKHVIKMILESAQMLCTAHWLGHLKKADLSLSDFKRVKDAQSWLFNNVSEDLQPPWKLTHARHPCTVWASKNVSNYGWVLRLAESLLQEYTRRYKKKHASHCVVKWLGKNFPPDIPDGFLTNHPVCMKEDYKVYDTDGNISVVKSYKNYYILDKSRFAKWEPQAKMPEWFSAGIKTTIRGKDVSK
jgi:hypothetical protein